MKNYPIYEPQRKLKVVAIGAGASGLLLAYRLQRHLDDFELIVFEKNAGLSGTWYENRYPGCACDVPSHCYTWSFEPKVDWSANYATAREINQYFSDFATKYHLNKYIKTQHVVTDARWNGQSAQWQVTARNVVTGEEVHENCHILVNTGGILNAWRYPAIPGLEDYKGELVHSAAWNPNLSLKGKTIGLIGNGSSGIQILPAVKGEAKHVVNFLREATWISPPLGQEYKVYTEEEKAEFGSNPAHHLNVRKEIERSMNNSWPVFFRGSEAQNNARQYMESEMKAKLRSPELEKLLIPDWSVGCRRLTPGTNYLESLTDPNVSVVFGEITKITEKGCVVDDKEHPVDVLICATGFDTTFKPRFPLIGSHGRDLSDVWRDEAKAYFGVGVDSYPNYFMTLGPNCPIGNGPVLIAIEAEIAYILSFITKFQKENVRTFEVTKEVVDDFNDHKDELLSHLIWTDECRSWYKAGSVEGKVVAIWPGSTLHYLETLASPRYEDYQWTYEDRNRFAYLGNGFSSAEKRCGDLSWYIKNSDDLPIDPCVKKSIFERKEEKVPAADYIPDVEQIPNGTAVRL